jgi:geranylgeranyl diphosphate synthase type I
MTDQFDTNFMLTSLEDVLHSAVETQSEKKFREYYSMMAYHLGWEGEGSGPDARGKRIRPMLVLLSCSAAGGDWRNALPAAASVELVHNFSLIHDDIQDNSPLRRGRETVWKRWGIAQAINAGDAMLTIAHLTLLKLEKSCSPEQTLLAAHTLQQACLELTKGKYLDLAFEAREELSIEAYWLMVKGKTASLIGACTELGAISAACPDERRTAFREFGLYLGLAFQAQDDILGIWGDAALTGKSSDSDLLAGKKSLPVIFGMHQEGPFNERWSRGSIQPGETEALAKQLEKEGAREYTQEAASQMTTKALNALEEARPEGEASLALAELADRLLRRDV